MNCFLIAILLFRASVFSLDGLGEDRSVFEQPLIDIENTARISLLLRPEFSLLNEGMEFRSIFWTNPFNFRLSVPVSPDLKISIGNQERFNQDFDLYYREGDLTMHTRGAGSIDEVNGTVQVSSGSLCGSLRAGYLWGNAREIWNYYVGGYSLVDTFNYKYQGYVFSGCFQYEFLSLAGEGLGRIQMAKSSVDTTFDLPRRLTLRAAPRFLDGNAIVILEKTIWDAPFLSPLRFRIGFGKESYQFTYSYNPWYLEGISEHGVDLRQRIAVSKSGVIDLQFGIALRNRGELREFCVTPQIRLEVNEFFTRRKR